ncbi:MAG: hypothetical protein D6674_04365 [Acidobacteria bacterium]|jgi:hypothetical protein|nr:MAG: hypothetical protein D6674_04365 [Acidobacteriota bacterium]
MRLLKTKGDRAISFIMGLAYGYRNANLELHVKKIEDFSYEEHEKDRVYYIDRTSGELHECITDKTTHICAVREDKIRGKVMVFIYKN